MRRLAGLMGLLAASALAGSVRAGELVVIVHPERDAQPTMTQLAQIYLKKRRFWKNGERIVPVNRDSGSAERASFVRSVFGEEARHLSMYWNQQYFRGVLPPATLASDEAVVRFVASEPLAIGYVRPGAEDDSVRVVLRIHDSSSP
jgi:ABC-type phosphate transport system substrate-binding protein